MYKVVAIFFSCLIFLTGCATSEQKVEPNYYQQIEPLLLTRPEEPKLIDDIKTVKDVLDNALAWQFAYYELEDYCNALEEALKMISLGSVNETTEVVVSKTIPVLKSL